MKKNPGTLKDRPVKKALTVRRSLTVSDAFLASHVFFSYISFSIHTLHIIALLRQ